MSYYTRSGTNIAIIGAGIGGLACAIKLKLKLEYEDFVIYEQAGDIGGTWRDNIYPGCASDVPMSLYTMSTDLRSWKDSHGSREDIYSYWCDLTKKYNLRPHISFNSTVVSADWDQDAQVYILEIEDTFTKERYTTTANVLISAVGGLSRPKLGSIPGTADFKGDMFHSARWNRDIDLRNKRVAVIGNGSSAAQFVPRISDDPTVDVVQFCRSPAWAIFAINTSYSPLRRWIFWNVPFLALLWRFGVFLFHEFLYIFFYWNGRLTQPAAKLILSTYMKHTAPGEYHKDLTPDHMTGCKRIIVDKDYYASLHRPNVHINRDGIDKITEDGITTKKGTKIPFDVIILATGFDVHTYPIAVRGNGGQTISEYYESVGGPQAYLGTTVPCFPNFFLIFGPNVGTGHMSILYSNELQANYIIDVITPILKEELTSIEVTKEADASYNQRVQRKLCNEFYSGCTSFYQTQRTGKNTYTFPWSATYFMYLLRKPVWKHYTGPGMYLWLQDVEKVQRKIVLTYIITAMIFAIFIFVLAHGYDYDFIIGCKDWLGV